MPDYMVTSPDGTRYRVTGPEGSTEDDAIDKVRRQKASEPMTGDQALHEAARLPGGVTETLAKGVMAPLNFAAWLTGTQGKGLQGLGEQALSPYLHQPEPQTPAGRIARGAGEAIGMAVPFMGATGRAARGVDLAAQAVPQAGLMPAIREGIVRPMAERPLAMAGLDVASGALGGTAQQGAAEAGAPPLVQGLAGVAGGLAAPLGMAALRVGTPGGEAGNLIFRGGPPRMGAAGEELSQTEHQMFQLVTDTLRAEGWTPPQIDKYLRDLDWSRRFHTAGARGRVPEGLPGSEGGPMGPPGPIPGSAGTAEDAAFGPANPFGTTSRNIYSEAPRRAGIAEMTPGMQRLVAHEVRHNLEAANVAKPVFAARQYGYAKAGQPEPELAPDLYTKYDARLRDPYAQSPSHYQAMRDARRRALRIEDDTHHNQMRTADQTDDLILADQKAVADRNFTATRNIGDKVPLTKERGLVAAFKNLQRAATRQDLNPEIAGHLQWMAKQYAPSGTLVKNIADFDNARRVVSERIGNLMRGKGGSTLSPTAAAKLQEQQKAIITAARNIKTKGLGEAYGKGIDEFGEDSKMLGDIQLGRDIFAGTADRRLFDTLTRGAQNRAKLGYLSAWERKMQPLPGRTDITKRIESEKDRLDLSYLIERSGMRANKITPEMTRDPDTGRMVPTKAEYRDRPERLQRYEDLEAAIIGTKELSQGGSLTATHAASDEMFDTLHTIKEVFKSAASPKDAAMRVGEYALQKLFGQRADVSAKLIRFLLSPDPAVQARGMAEVKMRLGSQTRIERFNEIMRLAGRQSVMTGPGTAGGVLAGAQQERQ